MFNNLERFWQDEDGTISMMFGGGSFGKLSPEKAADFLVFLLSKKNIRAFKVDNSTSTSCCGPTEWKPPIAETQVNSNNLE